MLHLRMLHWEASQEVLLHKASSALLSTINEFYEASLEELSRESARNSMKFV